MDLPTGLKRGIQDLWVDKQKEIDEEKECIKVKKLCEIVAGLIKKHKLRYDIKILHDFIVINQKVINTNRNLNKAHFGNYGFFSDGVWGGEDPIGYENYLSNSIEELKNKRVEKGFEALTIIFDVLAKSKETFDEDLKRIYDRWGIAIFKKPYRIEPIRRGME